jgi:glycerol-3-phosphate dehydrogenase subunit C
MAGIKEGNLEAPKRHPLDWQTPSFYDEDDLNKELERVFDICHGCRRCVSLCHSFPTLFDLVDESDTMEVDGVDKKDYWKVVEHCYLCDLCYMTKCPYVPPHEWNVDFPHLMLRAKAVNFKKGHTRKRDKILSSTDILGKLVTSIPLVDVTTNALNNNKTFRKALEAILDVHRDAPVPAYHYRTLRKQAKHLIESQTVQATAKTTGKVVLFSTCYGNYNSPEIAADLIRVFQYNNIEVKLAQKEVCCGMPKLELGDLDTVASAKQINIPLLAELVEQGYDIVAPVPSCVLMFKQELPLMFPDDAAVIKVQQAIYDPFEYLMLRHKDGLLSTAFKNSLGDVSYHVACHLRVQNIGLKTRDVLALIPETSINPIERCSGHDGTYAVKKEFHPISVKIARPVAKKIDQVSPDHLASDCPMAARHIADVSTGDIKPEHPMSLLAYAYGLKGE